MTLPSTNHGTFHQPIAYLLAPHLAQLSEQLSTVLALRDGEAASILDAATPMLHTTLRTHLLRVLLVELHAARDAGDLVGEDSESRWKHFLELASGPAFWFELAGHYPCLLPRVHEIVTNRCAAVLMFAQRWGRDRHAASDLLDGPSGALKKLEFDAGDSHRGGQSVVIVHCDGGKLLYKPRDLHVDTVLAAFIARLATKHPEGLFTRVPRAIARRDYGWAEFIPHRYADDAAELADFYVGLGQWLALLRLLGGSDMHGQNLIAHGPYPVVVDCETLFTPRPTPIPTGYGQATDRALAWVSGSVLATGLLPSRGSGLGWRGVDVSAAGALSQEQPMMRQLGIANAGTDQARLSEIWVPAPVMQNHPSAEPALVDHWPQILSAFDRLNVTLRRLDRDGGLNQWFTEFGPCRIRVVPRPTETYGELARMLWHPVSLHNEARATLQASDLLARMASHVATAPGDPEIIAAELADLKAGDIPFFTAVACEGRLDGPRGTRWRAPEDLVGATLAHWRTADLAQERHVAHAALASAYVNDGLWAGVTSLWPAQADGTRLDERRRAQASAIMQDILERAIMGEDGSVAWIAPVFSPGIGWTVLPLAHDLYDGLSGIAVLTAAYLHEVGARRADPVEGVGALHEAILLSLTLAEDRHERVRAERIAPAPLPPGLYAGIGGLIWTWLVLEKLGQDRGLGVVRACALARLLPASLAASTTDDVLSGVAGAIMPLLLLAERTGDQHYLDQAREAGDQLAASAVRDSGTAHWPHAQWPQGLGGFAHGASGIAWALTCLADATDWEGFRTLAKEALAFEDSLFDDDAQNWRDLRAQSQTTFSTTWCNGAVGIGLATLSMDPMLAGPSTPRLLRQAVNATWRDGIGINHCACHGDASALEFLDAAIRAGIGPRGVDCDDVLAHWLTGMEEHGLHFGIAPGVFSPSLMAGAGGIAYQLLRAHPDSSLPSILVPSM
jgi:type 2 lantibiotic biosynthesis protein LanM